MAKYGIVPLIYYITTTKTYKYNIVKLKYLGKTISSLKSYHTSLKNKIGTRKNNYLHTELYLNEGYWLMITFYLCHDPSLNIGAKGEVV